MDQQPTTTPGVRLPQPSLEPMIAQPAVPQYSTQPLQPMIQPPQATPVQQMPQQQTPAPIVPPAPLVASAAVPVSASDDDTHDEEWVAKAKDITTTYRDDPYAQSTALAQLRTEYLQKQHNMTMKMGEK